MLDSNANTPIRVFVAAPLDGALIDALQRMQQSLQRFWKPGAVRWASPDQMHLTLKFFGTVATDQVPGLESVLRRVGQDFSPFQLRAEHAGCFPDLHRPRVVWVGLGGNLEPLGQLQARIERETAAWGDHQESRPFQPHLTLGRVKSTRPAELQGVGDQVRALAQSHFGTWTVNQVQLMQSQLSPGGAIYTVLAEVPLGRADV